MAKFFFLIHTRYVRGAVRENIFYFKTKLVL